MAMERSELEQRRRELARSLPTLSDERANTYRRNSDALALDRAGVKHERPDAMARLGEAELAADGAIHLLGLALALAGALWLVTRAFLLPPGVQAASVLIYGAGLVVAPAMSAAYSMWPVLATWPSGRRFTS